MDTGKGGRGRLRPNNLVSSFIRQMGPALGDRNQRSSITAALRIAQSTELPEKDLLACLVRAYVAARSTRKVREEHRHPDGDNRMPLFATLFRRFAVACAGRTWHYDEENLVADIGSDDRLHDWLIRQSEIESQEMPEEEAPAAATIADEDPEADDPDDPDDEESAPAIEQLEAEDPGAGWSTPKSADHWGERLRDRYGRDAHSYEVLPTPHGRFGIRFRRRATGQTWDLLATEVVQRHLRGEPLL